MKITIKRDRFTSWYREYDIYMDGKYNGYIVRYKKTDNYEVFIDNIITPTRHNDEYRTVKECKRAIIENLKIYYDE